MVEGMGGKRNKMNPVNRIKEDKSCKKRVRLKWIEGLSSGLEEPAAFGTKIIMIVCLMNRICGFDKQGLLGSAFVCIHL